jgi:hypothetical protein
MVRYGVKDPGATGFTMNFAESGLYIQATNVRPPGAVLQIEIQAPDRKFALRGKVVWAKRSLAGAARGMGSGMGVQILEPTPEWIAFCETESGRG